MQLNKKSQTVIMLTAIIVVIILFISSNNTLFQGTTDYGTGLTINTQATNPSLTATGIVDIPNKVVLTVDNSLNYKDAGQVFDSDRYIVSWLPGEYSDAITAKVDFKFTTRWVNFFALYNIVAGIFGSSEFPQTALRNNYWWEVTYTDTSGVKTRIIDGRNYTTSNSAVNLNYISMVRGIPNRNFPTIGLVEETLPTHDGSANWWAPQNTPSATETMRIETDTLVFKMKGQRVGTLNIKCYLKDLSWAKSEFNAPLLSLLAKWYEYQSTGPFLLSEDNCYLAPGTGEVRVESLNSIKSAGSDTAEGTNVVYTKYVWAEGQNVTFNIKTGYSGTSLQPDQEGYKEGWYLKFTNSKGETVKTGTIKRYVNGVWTTQSLSSFTNGLIPLADGLSNYRMQFQIPTGAFILNDPNDNEWMVTLSNTLFDQSETRIFVVDSLAKVPGQAKAVFDKDQYDQWDICTLTLTATANPAGTNNIARFRVWVTYDGWTSTNYAMTEKVVPAVLKSGTTYTATVTFQVSQGDKNLYATTVAIDSQGRAGPEGEDQAYVKQVLPGEGIFSNIDNNTIYLILAVMIIIIAGGIGLYLYQKRGAGKTSFKLSSFKLPKWGKKK